MTLNRPTLVLIATLGSAALLLGALAFQFIGELPPCKMCYWQRYPHVAAVMAGALWFFAHTRLLIWIGALSALTTGLIGVYHAGVEQDWWEGPTTCTSGNISGLSTDELLDQIMNAPLVRCDEIPWEMLGLSMAGWNAVISLGLAAIWFAAALRR